MPGPFNRLARIWADGAYAGQLIEWVKTTCHCVLEIVKRSDTLTAFRVLPHRWVVERTFGWLNRYRRLAKDYERLPESSELTPCARWSQPSRTDAEHLREKLIEPLGLIVDEEKHVIHDTYTGLEYRYRAALDDILRMAERREFDLLCLDVLDRGLGRKGVSREVFRGQLRELGIHILTTEPSDHSDDDSLEGQLMRLLKGYKAEEEVNDFVRRTRNAIRDKALGNSEKGIPPKVIGNGTRMYG